MDLGLGRYGCGKRGRAAVLRWREHLALLVPLGLVLLPFLIVPVVSGLAFSFTNFAPAQVRIQWLGLRNYLAILSDKSFISSWKNLLIFVIGAVPAELAIGFGLAYLLRRPFRGRSIVRLLLFLPWLVSPIANGVMWYFLLNLQVGIINFVRSWLGLANLPSPLGIIGLALPTTIAISVWQEAPLAAFLLLPGMLVIPASEWEYAVLEGASAFDRIIHVAWPRLRPLFLAVALLLTGSALGVFDTILILTGGGPGSATMTPALYSFQQAFQFFNWPVGATSAWFIVASIVVVGLIYLRLTRSEVA